MRLTAHLRTFPPRSLAMSSSSTSATDVEPSSENEAPRLSALFLIRFDKKVGYVRHLVVLTKRADCDSGG
jgi:hypothetical protein